MAYAETCDQRPVASEDPPYRILVVEDSLTQADYLVQMLKNHGYVVGFAGDGQEALRLIPQFKPDLVISDIIMPELDGYALCKSIKECAQWSEVGVVLVTSLADSESILAALEAGADNFLMKPIDERHLISRVQYMQANNRVRKEQRVELGLEIQFRGRRQFINASRIQLINILINSYETAVEKNAELLDAQTELRALNDALEARVAKRTELLQREAAQREISERELRKTNVYLNVLEEVARLANEPAPMEQTCQAVLEVVCSAIGWPLAHVYFVEPDSRRLVPSNIWHVTDAGLFKPFMSATQGLQFDVGEGIPGRVLATRDPEWYVIGEQGALDFYRKDAAEKVSLATIVAAPVFRGDQAIAVLEFFNHTPLPRDEALVAALVRVCDSLGVRAQRESSATLLRTSEERFHLAVEGSQDGIWDCDILTKEIWFSPRIDMMLGHDPGELPHTVETFVSRLHPEDAAATHEAIRRHIDEAAPYDIECRLRTNSGEYRWFRARGASVRDASGAVVRMSGTIRDITDAKARELELSRLALAVEQSRDGVIIAGVDGQAIYTNTAMRSMIERRPGAEGLILDVIFEGAKDADTLINQAETALKAGHPFRSEFHRKGKTGGTEYWDVTILPVVDNLGKIANFVATVRDETQRMKWENRLRHAQRMEAMGTLAGGIAHDFNNLLSAILGYGGMLFEPLAGDERAQEDLRQVLVAGDRATELVRQILTFSRQSETERGPVHLDAVTKEVAKLIRASVPSTIRIDLDLQSGCPPVLADSTQMNQVLMNLCTNAYQAIGNNRGALHVGLHGVEIDDAESSPHADLAPGQYLVLIVEDTGPGIDPATMERIFDPYFTTKRPGEGTGLGLATVHGIVQSHGGAITVYSEIGKGTAFRVYLPALPKNSAGKSPDETTIPRGNERVLLIDDEESILRLTERMTQSLGYETFAFKSPLEALQFLNDNPAQIDIVLTDHYMPERTGDEVATLVRSIRPDMPILLLTGFWKNEETNGSLPANVDQLLIKPVDIQALAHALRRALEKNPTLRPPCTTNNQDV